MKALLIDVVCKTGSTGKIVYDLYKELNSEGGEAAVCYGRGQTIKEKNIYKFGLDWETYLHAFLTRITGYTGCFSFFSTRRLIKFIKGFKPDVVHLHELHAYYVNIVPLLNFLKKQNIRVIHTLHCAFSYTGKCGHHLNCSRWKTECGDCPKLKEYVSTKWFDRTKTMFLKKKKAFSGFKDMTIVCPSNWLADYARQSFLGEYQVEVIRNGIDVSIFKPVSVDGLREKLKISKDEKVVLAVAPKIMSREKGGKWVLEIAKILKNERIRFILIGLDKEDVEHEKNVVLVKNTSNQKELAQYYSMADLFVICSEMENFPTTCLEAQCCGAPICGFDVGGVKETSLLDKDLFVPYGDVNGLAAIVRGFLNDPYRVDKKLLSGKAAKLFSKETMANAYFELYKRGDRK